VETYFNAYPTRGPRLALAFQLEHKIVSVHNTVSSTRLTRSFRNTCNFIDGAETFSNFYVAIMGDSISTQST